MRLGVCDTPLHLPRAQVRTGARDSTGECFPVGDSPDDLHVGQKPGSPLRSPSLEYLKKLWKRHKKGLLEPEFAPQRVPDEEAQAPEKMLPQHILVEDVFVKEDVAVTRGDEAHSLGAGRLCYGGLMFVIHDGVGRIDHRPTAFVRPVGQVDVLPVKRMIDGVEAAELEEFLPIKGRGAARREESQPFAALVAAFVTEVEMPLLKHSDAPPGQELFPVPAKQLGRCGEEIVISLKAIAQPRNRVGLDRDIIVEQNDDGESGNHGADICRSLKSYVGQIGL